MITEVTQDHCPFGDDHTILPLPPLPEQTAIANYLDQQTAAIDKKTALLQQKIATYLALRKSIINETVCRGLNKSAPLKDSGIEWIGEIPAHWGIKRGKDVTKTKYGLPLDSSLFVTSSTEGFPIIRIRDLLAGDIQTYYKGDINKDGIINNCSLLVGMDGDFQVVRWVGNAALLNQRICEISGRQGLVESNYLYYYLPIVMKVINDQKFYTTVKHLSDPDFKTFLVIAPPLSEQIAIATYLDQKTEAIDAAVANLNAQLSMLAELRKALINEVVTGQIRVVV